MIIDSNVIESFQQILMSMKSGVTVEHEEENINTIRLPSQYRWRSNSIEGVNSSLFPTDSILEERTISPPKADEISSNDEKLSSPLLIVGNAKKYSITQTKAKDRQVATSTQQSLIDSQRDYGEVYTRRRVNYFDTQYLV